MALTPRGRQPTDKARRNKVMSYCWCMSKIVWVTQDDVLNGTTLSCGRPACTALKQGMQRHIRNAPGG